MSPAISVLRKDLQLAWRDRGSWFAALAFAATSLLVYSAAFDLTAANARPLLPGVLWTTFLFSGIFASGHTLPREAESGTLDAVLVAPVSPSVIYVGKVVSNLLSLLLVELALLALATILFDTPLLTPELMLVVLLGTLSYVALATLLSTLSTRARARDLLVPVLALPLLVPMLIGSIRATAGALGEPVGSAPWLLLLLVFALWSTVGGALLFPVVSER